MSRAVDAVVVGAGVIGCAVAYYASRRGLQVVLIDQPKRGRATSASAGGLWPLGESSGIGCGVIVHRALVERGSASPTTSPARLPREFLEFSLRSNAMFPQLAAELREATRLDIELQKTSLMFLAYDEDDEAFSRPLAEDPSLDPSLVEWLSPDSVHEAEPNVAKDIRGAIRFRGDDQLNPYVLADALRDGARRAGALVLDHTEVIGIEVLGGQVRAVRTGVDRIPCAFVVNAAGAWASELGRMVGIEIPVQPVRGQIVCTEALPSVISACLSTGDCYIVQKQHGEVLIGSTTEEVGFHVGVTPAAIRELCSGAARAVPRLSNAVVKRVWSGLRPGSPDELPILGPVDAVEGFLNATGHFRTGIVNAPLTGLLLANIMSGKKPSVSIAPFLLSRFPAGTHEWSE